MAKVTIGGVEVGADLPSFYEMEKAWSFLQVVQGSPDNPMIGVNAILGVIAVGETVDGAVPDRTPEQISERIVELKKKLSPKEMAGLRPFVNDLMVELGMAVRTPEGELEPAEGAAAGSPSTAISQA